MAGAVAVFVQYMVEKNLALCYYSNRKRRDKNE